MIVGDEIEGVTLNPPVSVTTSVFVVRVTSRTPNVADGLIVRNALALVGELTVTEDTVMPEPKVAVVVP